MNWQTQDILKAAEEVISDEGIFSPDQIAKLSVMIDLIGKAIARESDCNKPSITM